MIRTMYRSSQGELFQKLAPEKLREAIADPHGDLWVDIVHVPSNQAECRKFLEDHFPFHPLALDDAFQENHVPRLDNWENHIYLVFHALDLEVNRTLDTHELDVFVGPNYLVTIHEEPIRALDQLWSQCRQGSKRPMASGPDYLLYSLSDAMVAAYMPIVDGLDDEIDELEDEIFHSPTKGTIGRIFRLRRTILKLRRMLGYLREVMNKLARDENEVVDDKDRIYFRDVYDHLVRLYDIVEGLRDMAGGALDTYMSVTSNRINEIMRTLTIVTVLFMPISFLSGFFGMNFFGEQFNIANPWDAHWLFWFCLLAMLTVPPSMIWWMLRKGWLRSVAKNTDLDLTK